MDKTNKTRPSGALKPSFVPANIQRRRESSPTVPDFDARVAENRLPNRVNVRRAPRAPAASTASPDTPRPAPVGSPDYSSTRQTGETGLPAILKPALVRQPRIRPNTETAERNVPRYNGTVRPNPTTVTRPTTVRERPSIPRSNPVNPPAREVRSNSVPRPSPASSFKPSAPRAQPATAPRPAPARSEPAPIYTAPVTRAESRPQADSSSGTTVNRHDGGRREPQR